MAQAERAMRVPKGEVAHGEVAGQAPADAPPALRARGGLRRGLIWAIAISIVFWSLIIVVVWAG